jgi:hypothetical protein
MMKTLKRTPLVAVTLAVTVACGAPSQSQPASRTPEPRTDALAPGDVVDDAQALSPRAAFVRASLDLRGVRPTSAELLALDANPDALDAAIDAFVDDVHFGERVKDFFAPAYRTRVQEYFRGDPAWTSAEVQKAIGEEPLELIAHLAVNNIPYNQVVTAPYTVVDRAMLGLWPLEEIDADGAALAPGKMRARYTDGRVHAGVLSMNSFYWRHPSSVENANRGRTNALTTALLCSDYLQRPIEFPRDLDLLDTTSINNAIRQNNACTACHSTMDPIGAHMWGFMYDAIAPNVFSTYKAEREREWQRYLIGTGTENFAPSYYGKPTDGTLRGLGDAMADDDRLVRCAVKRVYEGMMGGSATLDDEGALVEHREAFLAGQLSLKALVRSVAKDPAYRGVARKSVYGGYPAPVLKKVIGTELMQEQLAAMTGMTMLSADGRDLLAFDAGVRSLAGGSDRGSSSSPSPGLVLVLRRMAEKAAALTVTGQKNGQLAATLAATTFDRAPTDEELSLLLQDTLSLTPADGSFIAARDAYRALYDEVAGVSSSTTEAWAALLTALLSDPSIALY